MFKRNLFEAAMKKSGKSVGDVACFLQINRTTLYKKLAQKTDFTRAEVQTLKDYFGLSVQETMEIFYA